MTTSIDDGVEHQRWDIIELTDYIESILVKAGLRPARARLVADSLVDAQARGIASHGIARTRIYAERLQAGLLNAAGEPRVVRRSSSAILIDADNAIGHVGANAAVQEVIGRTTAEPVTMVGVRNSNHCGTLGYFARQAAAHGYVVLAMSTAPITMTYHGGRSRAVGTNPLCICFPVAGQPPIVIDMATSATARGKIILAEKLGQTIPPGWAVDVLGKPTQDASEALKGAVVPFAGPKGSGLAMAIDLLAGAMTGSPTGPQIGDMYEDWSRPQRVGHLFFFIDPNQWQDGPSFAATAGQFAQYVHDLDPAAGFDQVLLPGEIEERQYKEAVSHGLVVPPAVIEDLDALSNELQSSTGEANNSEGAVQ